MAANRTFIIVNWSLQRSDHGEQPFWAAEAKEVHHFAKKRKTSEAASSAHQVMVRST